MPQLGEMRIAAVARIPAVIDNLRRDAGRTIGEHDHPVGEEERLLDVVGHHECGEARALPQGHELALHGDARQRLTQQSAVQWAVDIVDGDDRAAPE
jgi:hypothetical protein